MFSLFSSAPLLVSYDSKPFFFIQRSFIFILTAFVRILVVFYSVRKALPFLFLLPMSSSFSLLFLFGRPCFYVLMLYLRFNFQIEINIAKRHLLQGSNYFWLTWSILHQNASKTFSSLISFLDLDVHIFVIVSFLFCLQQIRLCTYERSSKYHLRHIPNFSWPFSFIISIESIWHTKGLSFRKEYPSLL